MTDASMSREKPMTPFESLMWNAWMPKIRSVVNNSWSADDPQPLIRVYEAWASFLPAFVRDNFFDQLVLPKVQNAVAEWSARKAVQTGVTLRTLIFPWLPHLGLRVESLLDDARRKIKSLLRAWTPLEDVPTDLAVWKEVFASAVWDNMTLKYVVPKLGALLRDDFKVNPRAQDDTPIRRVLAWAGVASGQDLLRPSVIASLFETGFFPKWLDVLHVWLTAPGANYAQIADWYTQWVALFPERVQALPQVRAGFTLGQQMMHTALALGPSAAATLAKPVFPPASADRTKATSKPTPAARLAPTAPAKEITFRDIVEEEAAQHNLLFIPAGRVHAKSRMPLFKVTTRADGRGGLLVYVMDDAVWAADPASAVGEDDEWRAISLENMVLRATKGGGA
jgi:tuftelin-interacting protein 11